MKKKWGGYTTRECFDCEKFGEWELFPTCCDPFSHAPQNPHWGICPECKRFREKFINSREENE